MPQDDALQLLPWLEPPHGNEELKAERFINTKAKGFLNFLTQNILTVSLDKYNHDES